MIEIIKKNFLFFPKLSIISLILIVLSVLLDLPLPLLTVYYIDKVIVSRDISLLNLVGFLLVILTLLKLLIDIIKVYVTSKLFENLIMEYGVEAFKNFINSYYLEHISKPSGYWLSRIQNEPQALAVIYKIVVDFFTNVVTFIVGLGVIFYFSFDIGLLVLALLPVYILVFFYMSPKLKKQNLVVKEKKAKLTGFVEESLNGFEILKVLALENFRIQEIKKKWAGVINENLKWVMIVSLNGLLSSAVVLFAPIAVLWYGGYLVITGSLTLGKVIGINRFLSYVFSPINSFITFNSQIQDANTSFERLKELEKFDKECYNGNKIELKPNSSIQIIGLDFSYGPNKILENLNLTIKGGITTAIVGSSGCGKSTILKLLVGLLKQNNGEIIIGESSLNGVDVRSLRNQVCLIPQNAYLFSGSLEYNIRLNDTSEKFDDYLFKVTGIDQFIKEFSLLNNDYEIGNRGLKLSGGQRQRIALARALIREPKILLMDEFTSEIDLINERDIINSIIDLRKGKTTIIVAHGLSAIINVEEIIVMSKNGVEEIGTHDQLIRNKKLYSELWAINNGGIN